MKLPKRFALSTLMLVMLLVSLVFGYAQWRRQWLIRQVAELQAESHSDVALNDHWFWPTVNAAVTVQLFEVDDNTYIRPPANYSMLNSNLSEGTRYTRKAAEAYFSSIRDQYHAIGVEEVFFRVSNPNRGLEMIEIVD
jgi:hypothetical protein